MKLIFVYNAKSDRMSKMFDFAHKIISPSTYACDLCSLTHGNFGEREEWTQFREATDLEMEFYHIEDFESKFNAKDVYPVIFKITESGLEKILDKETISNISELHELISALKMAV